MNMLKITNPQTLDTLPTGGKVYFGKVSTLEVVSHEHVQYIRQYVKRFTTSHRAKVKAFEAFVKDASRDLVWSYSATPNPIEG